MLGLALKESKNQLRGPCPSCNSGGDRALVLTPERGLFYCFSMKVGGDCLALVQHITGIEVQEAAEFLLPQEEPHSAPSPTKKATTKGGDNRPEFDPQAFLEKLEYSEEVEATGLSEEDAKSLGVGLYRGKLYQAARWPNGDIACFTTAAGDSLKFPKQLVRPKEAKVIRLEKQRA